MEEKEKNIIFSNTLDDLLNEHLSDYLAHAICLEGSCLIRFNGEDHIMNKGDLLIVRKGSLVEKVVPEANFRVEVAYVHAKYIALCAPKNNYGTKGQLALFLNPIIHLNEVQFARCQRDFEELRVRLLQTDHRFYTEMVANKMQMLILDFFDFHASLHEERNTSTQYATIMNRFIALLESGEYRAHREVTWYADRLCITSKYLSEVSKSVSGYGANFWINRYTVIAISRLLRDKSLSFVQISDMFGFSSPAYFSRYVLHNLGVSPSSVRG